MTEKEKKGNDSNNNDNNCEHSTVADAALQWKLAFHCLVFVCFVCWCFVGNLSFCKCISSKVQNLECVLRRLLLSCLKWSRKVFCLVCNVVLVIDLLFLGDEIECMSGCFFD
jgi:hypothetical protein